MNWSDLGSFHPEAGPLSPSLLFLPLLMASGLPAPSSESLLSSKMLEVGVQISVHELLGLLLLASTVIATESQIRQLTVPSSCSPMHRLQVLEASTDSTWNLFSSFFLNPAMGELPQPFIWSLLDQSLP